MRRRRMTAAGPRGPLNKSLKLAPSANAVKSLAKLEESGQDLGQCFHVTARSVGTVEADAEILA